MDGNLADLLQQIQFILVLYGTTKRVVKNKVICLSV